MSISPETGWLLALAKYGSFKKNDSFSLKKR